MMIHQLPIDDGFTAQQLVFTQTWYPMDGRIEVDFAAEILPGLRPSQMFTYLFRRFGYPHRAWDETKELAGYFITTPRADVALRIVPPMWMERTMGVNDAHFAPAERMTKVYVHERTRDALEREWRAYRRAMRAGEGYASRPIAQAIQGAVQRTLHDLLRPVRIDDSYLSCYGCMDDDDVPRDEEGEPTAWCLEPPHEAGYPVHPEFFAQATTYDEFTDALETLGQGDLAAGVRRVIALAHELS